MDTLLTCACVGVLQGTEVLSCLYVFPVLYYCITSSSCLFLSVENNAYNVVISNDQLVRLAVMLFLFGCCAVLTLSLCSSHFHCSHLINSLFTFTITEAISVFLC